MGRPCKLQFNARGAWRDVLQFDLDAVDDEALQVAAVKLLLLADPQGGTKARICMADSFQSVLLYWDAKSGWRER